MDTFQAPEICRTPLEDLLLQMRSLGIKDVESFPFPTPPPLDKLRQALKLLTHLGILSNTGGFKSVQSESLLQKKENLRVLKNSGGEITALGSLISRFPLNPRLSKMLVIAHRSNMLSHGLNLVASLAEKSPFLNEQETIPDDTIMSEEELQECNSTAQLSLSKHPESDALARMKALGAFSFVASGDASSEQKNEFCVKQNLLRNTLDRMLDLRSQLTSLCSAVFDASHTTPISFATNPPTAEEETALRQILLTGYCDCIARKAPPLSEGSRRMRLAAYLSCNSDVTTPVYIHPSSTLFKPVWVFYSH